MQTHASIPCHTGKTYAWGINADGRLPRGFEFSKQKRIMQRTQCHCVQCHDYRQVAVWYSFWYGADDRHVSSAALWIAIFCFRFGTSCTCFFATHSKHMFLFVLMILLASFTVCLNIGLL